SGSLHFGSLIAALGSYLRAKNLQGRWLVRMEDLDPPREVPGAADDILRTLECFGLHWDGPVLYQSTRLDAYQAKIDALLKSGDAYYCQCTRKQIQTLGGVYQGHCRELGLSRGAVRIHNRSRINPFDDVLMGHIKVDQGFAAEDFILKRSDGLFAYQLAVVMDDALSGVTEVVRGADLIETSVRQLSLFRQFGEKAPQFLHLPLACAEPGFKLSKQNHATPVDKTKPLPALRAALRFLGQTEAQGDSVTELLSSAIGHFTLASIPRSREILI
ncbi:MAG: tRNA glutamyl-Q(34) synthetase GluQRS, partial [Plesiomonas shigelloides]